MADEEKRTLEVEAFADGMRWAAMFPTEDLTMAEIREQAPKAFDFLRSCKPAPTPESTPLPTPTPQTK